MRTESLLVGFAPDKTPVRRNNHGGQAWTAADGAENLHQPQDGAEQGTTAYSAITKKMMPREPEDARLTGGTRSLMRRVMGLNVTAMAAVRRLPAKAMAPKATQVA
ncbi:MAG TPA: hypothetical protein VMD97_10075 [Candidatus Aquilonibacter sp.]|nr:hypothetical protein [Candidatus Aquilonibacter sp.]